MSSERLIDDTNSPWWAEHIYRYLDAMNYITRSDNVLDLACGTGYGSKMLASKAKNVIGGDIDEEQIEANKKRYDYNNLNFEVLDGTDLHFKKGTFDVLVSFETIEHTTQYREMLEEFNRVTKKGGTLIISTPNKFLNSPKGKIVNPYHTQEWTPEEFKELLNSIFDNVTIYGEEYIRYKNAHTKNQKRAQWMEKLFYTRGIRKIPLKHQNKIMQSLIGKDMYPDITDYTYTQDWDIINKECVTQIAIIKK